MKCTVTETPLSGLLLLSPAFFPDSRGSFSETWNEEDFRRLTGDNVHFVQDNQSVSRKGVIRGLHWQKEPFAQGKLIRCAHGAVFDVALDIRTSSPTFGRWHGTELSAENGLQMWIPAGFAHGFISLSDSALLLYKTTEVWHPEAECSIRWDDPAIGIRWPVPAGTAPVLSPKDLAAPLFSEACGFFS